MRIYLDPGVHSLLKNHNMLMSYTHALKTWKLAPVKGLMGHYLCQILVDVVEGTKVPNKSLGCQTQVELGAHLSES